MVLLGFFAAGMWHGGCNMRVSGREKENTMRHERAKNEHGRELDYCKNCGWFWWPHMFDNHKGWECVPHIAEAFQENRRSDTCPSWTSYALDNPETPVHGD